MNNEKGPRYEMPEKFSLGKYESELDSNETGTGEKTTKKKLTKLQKRIIGIVSIIAGVALIVIGIIILSKSVGDFYGEDENVVTITMDDLKIEYFGYNGSGSLKVTVNLDKVRPKVLKVMGYDEDESSVGILKEAEMICCSYQFKICNPDNDYTDKDYGFIQDNGVNGMLTNGDTVKLVMYNREDWKNEFAEMLDETDREEKPEVILKFKEVTYTVDGFNDLVTIDIFKDVNIYTTGEDGSLSVEVEYTGDIKGLGSEVFTVKGKNGSLKYGDSVVISISKETESAIKLCDGIKLERNTKEYVIEQ